MTEPGPTSSPQSEPGDTDENDPSGNSVPNPETGAGIGAGSEPTTFEPEEDPEPVEDPTS